LDALLRVGLGNTAWAAALGLLAWAAARAWPRRPALAHALWLAVLVKLVTPSLLAFHVEVARPPRQAPPPTAGAAEGAPEPPVPAPAMPGPSQPADAAPALAGVAGRAPRPRVALPPWRAVVAGAWVTGVAAWWAAVGVYALRLRRFARAARPATDDLRERAGRVAARLGVRHAPEPELVPARISPMLWALFGRPRLLLPEALWRDLSPAQQDAVLAHELAHLRRGDHWVRRLELLVLGIHWWNPIAWWARREVERAEEPCCDAWVARALPGSAHDYAEALVATAAFLSAPRTFRPVGASGAGRARLLKRRLIMILSDHPSAASTRGAPRHVLPLAALGLLWLPVWAARAQDGDARGDRPAAAAKPDAQAATKPDPPPAGAPPAPAATEPPDLTAPPRMGMMPSSVKLTLVHPVEREVSDYLEFNGHVEPLQSADLIARVSGSITQVHVKDGDAVKRGQLLLDVDPAVYEAELARADAAVQHAQARRKGRIAQLTGRQNLEKKQVISRDSVAAFETEVEEAEADVKMAEAARTLAKLKRESARVAAPMDGRVSFVLSAGNTVLADKTLVATVVSVRPAVVKFKVDERAALRIARLRRSGRLPGAKGGELRVTMALADEPDFPHRGVVLAPEGPFDPSSGTAQWRAVFPDEGGDLVPGLFARVRVVTSAPHKALLVPPGAVFTDLGTGKYLSVSLGQPGRFVKRPVTLGQTHDGLVEVRDGELSPRDEIYAPGH
jgi:RND family efflux transporter MFP subunit